MKEEMLEVVNESDEIIGLETREKVHKEGLLHREIHIWFITPRREIIFQHRAKNKDTHPDKLDATVGGHVDPGMSYEETAVKECKEETGVSLELSKLKLIKKLQTKSFDKNTGRINHSLRPQYAYLFEGDLNDLRVEEGKAIGFEARSIDSLPDLSEDDKQKFVPLILTKEFFELFSTGQKLLGLK